MDNSLRSVTSNNGSAQRVRAWTVAGSTAVQAQRGGGARSAASDDYTRSAAARSPDRGVSLGSPRASGVGPVASAEALGFETRSSWQDELRAALSRRTPPDAQGRLAIPYMKENATGGMAARESGRGFGMEIEFTLPPEGKAEALRAIAEDLHAAGFTPTPQQVGHTHSTKPQSYEHQGGWRFETEYLGPAGEIVSPVCFDDPETWESLEKIIEIVRRHGGDVNATTGGHVHVGTGDFGDDIAPTNAVLKITKEFENELYLLATEPIRGTHRGTTFCMPNLTPAAGYASIGEARRSTTLRFTPWTSARDSVVNLSHLNGQSTDHLELRQWDSALREEVIQVHVKLSLALVEAGKRLAEREGGFADLELSPSRASGVDPESFEGRVARFTELFDLLFERDEDKRQAVALISSINFPRAQA